MRFVALVATVTLVACTGGTEVGNPSGDPDGGRDAGRSPGFDSGTFDAGQGGGVIIPMQIRERLDEFSDCFDFLLPDGSLAAPGQLLPPVLYGETASLALSARSTCAGDLQLVDWGTTDDRVTVALDFRPVPTGTTAEGAVRIQLEGAEPEGAGSLVIAVRITNGEATVDRYVALRGRAYSRCSSMDGASCRSHASCTWDDTTTACQ